MIASTKLAFRPIAKIESLNDMIADNIWRPRFSAWVFTVLSGLALVLTSAGIYSVVSFTATLRARGVGIRVALGATPRDVVAETLRGTMLPLACGLLLSLMAALLLSRLLTSLLYEIRGQQLRTLTVKDLCWNRNEREQNENLASPTPFRHQSSWPTAEGAPARRVHRN